MEISDKTIKPKRVSKKASTFTRYGMSNNFIFVACVLIASFAWLLIKLSGTYTVTYDFNVKFVDLPVDKKITSVADSNVNISFTSNGFTILKFELFNNMKQLQVPLKNYVLINEKDSFYKLSTQEIKKYLSEETEIPIENILFSKPYLGFEMDGLYAKKVRIIEKLSLKFKEQFGMYGDINVTPKKISVFGPKDILDTLQNIFTKKIEVNDVENEQSIIAELVNPYPDLMSFDPKTVIVNFKVEKFTESIIEVPVEIGAISNEITIFPKTIKVSFKIAQKDFNTISPEFFTVVPETEGVDLNKANKLKLKIIKKPLYISDERMVPSEVEFLIIK